jgi:hypothetical protein
MNAMPDLRHFLDEAHDLHARQPRAVADNLLARAATLPPDETGAEAVRLAEHVMLGHLADVDALRRFLQALETSQASRSSASSASSASSQAPQTAQPWQSSKLPRGPAADPAWSQSVVRAQWALATLAVESGAPTLPDAPRWRALQNVVLALAHRGRVADASARLTREAAAALSHVDAAARRAYAACTNNVALELREGPRGDTARDALMLEAAALARRAWTAAGTWLQVQRADYQLARCHAAVGHGAEALAFAQACLEACVANGAQADERFFAHEALWHAHRAAGDMASAATERQRMHALLEEIGDAEMRAWCGATLAAIGEA